jgi:hypothetical protein
MMRQHANDMEYRSVEQLLTNDGFLAWYFGTDKDQIVRWTNWIIASNENSELARKAYDLLQSIQEVEGTGIPAEDIDRVWAAIEAEIRREQQPPPAKEADS